MGHTQNANGDVDYDDDAADFSAAQRIMFGEGYKRSHTVEVLQLIFHGEDRPKEVGKEKVRVNQRRGKLGKFIACLTFSVPKLFVLHRYHFYSY